MTGFEQAETLLRRAGAGSGAAECHGFLAGCLCATGPAGLGRGLDHLLGQASGGLEPAVETARDLLQETIDRSRAGLEQVSPAFEPLLPGGERTAAERAAALGDWCVGFLGGLGHLDPRAHSTLTAELQEFVRDLTQITRVDADAAEAGNAEADLAALIDYVRAGVIRLYADLRGK